MKLSIVLAVLLSSAVFAAEEKKEEKTSMNTSNEVAVIKTSEGEMVVQFWTDAAPSTIENFKKLARSGFYDGTILWTGRSGLQNQSRIQRSLTPARRDLDGAWARSGFCRFAILHMSRARPAAR